MTPPITNRGLWICTYKGDQFFIEDPRPNEIDPDVIAHSLSLLCRYGGQCREFYSVAQHSVLVSQVVSPGNALWGLLHDAAEGLGLVDIPSSVKPLLPQYKVLENRILLAVARRFDLPWPMPDEVKEADAAVMAAEKQQLITSNVAWPNLSEPANVDCTPWSIQETKWRFLDRLEELYSRRRAFHGNTEASKMDIRKEV